MIGTITYWNLAKGYGFITVTSQKSPMEALSQEQYFFHWSNFADGRMHPVIGSLVAFQLGNPVSPGKNIQAVGVRFATAKEIEIEKGVNALASWAGA